MSLAGHEPFFLFGVFCAGAPDLMEMRSQLPGCHQLHAAGVDSVRLTCGMQCRHVGSMGNNPTDIIDLRGLED